MKDIDAASIAKDVTTRIRELMDDRAVENVAIAQAMARMEGSEKWTNTFHKVMAGRALAGGRREEPLFLRTFSAGIHTAAAMAGHGRLAVIGMKMGVAGKPRKFPPLLVYMTAMSVCKKPLDDFTKQDYLSVSKALGPGQNGKLADHRTVESLAKEGRRVREQTPFELVIASLPEFGNTEYWAILERNARRIRDAIKDRPAIAAAQERLDATIERLRLPQAP